MLSRTEANRHGHRLAIQFVLAIAMLGCSAPHIDQKILILGGNPPIDRPRLSVYRLDKAVEPVGTDSVSFRMPLVSSGFAGPQDVEASGEQVYSINFRSKDGLDEFHVFFDIQDRYVPRLSRKTEYDVWFYQRRKGLLLPDPQGLVVRDLTGRLLYLLSTDEAVPLDQIPPGIRLTPSRKVAFMTTAISKTGCSVEKEHLFLGVDSVEGESRLAPGEEQVVRGDEGYYRVVLFDNSISRAELDCLIEDPNHYSYMLQAVSGPR